MTAEPVTIEPVYKSLELACEASTAFRLFTEEVTSWWPLDTHSVCPGESQGCWFEPHEGGAFFERDPAGTRHLWGTVQRWSPPDELVFTFHPGRDPETAGTVALRFSSTATGCRVELRHSGWELLGAAAADMREGYDSGWQHVFCERFAGRAASTVRPAKMPSSVADGA
jgi:uncharacterized protein YndB with AHSA1/START domain